MMAGMEMDSVLEISPSLTACPPWRTSPPYSPWTGSSALRLRRARSALAKGENKADRFRKEINLQYMSLICVCVC